jgi:hypothetical protein
MGRLSACGAEICAADGPSTGGMKTCGKTLMSGVGKNSNALVGNGQFALEPQPPGPILVAFPPMSGKMKRRSVRPPGMADRTHSARGRAEVIPFQPRRLAQSPIWSSAGNHADISDERVSAGDDSDWRLRIIEDFLGLAWVVASMTAGYYMLTAVLTVS